MHLDTKYRNSALISVWRTGNVTSISWLYPKYRNKTCVSIKIIAAEIGKSQKRLCATLSPSNQDDDTFLRTAYKRDRFSFFLLTATFFQRKNVTTIRHVRTSLGKVKYLWDILFGILPLLNLHKKANIYVRKKLYIICSWVYK